MRVEQLGEGEPEIAVVGAVHGDEPCGASAVERLLAERPAVEEPVKLVIANEGALEAEARYLDADLNRSFPGDPDADTHEPRLAAELVAELEGCVTLSLHSTRSHAEPFAVVAGLDDLARAVLPAMSVVAVVETGQFVEGRLFATDCVVEVECGLQGSEAAADNAARLTREFLAALGALEEPTDRRTHPRFRLTRPIPKAGADEYEVFVENFQRVAPDQTFAAADGESVVAGESFYPVLLSAYGYPDMLGYAAERVGTLR
jgi:succinylglutamate desuccinylase